MKQHELSNELYLKPLAEHRLEMLKTNEGDSHHSMRQSSRLTDVTTGTLEDALEVIHQIEDKEFAAWLCLHSAAPSSSSHAHTLLDTATEIAAQHSLKEVSAEADTLKRRFTTYLQIGEEPFDGDGWCWFRDVPLREAMYIHLQAGDLQGARVVWRRHAVEENLADGFEVCS